jgi:hypothetical protein
VDVQRGAEVAHRLVVPGARAVEQPQSEDDAASAGAGEALSLRLGGERGAQDRQFSRHASGSEICSRERIRVELLLLGDRELMAGGLRHGPQRAAEHAGSAGDQQPHR